MDKIERIRQKALAHANDAKAAIQKATDENREPTASEQARFDEHMVKAHERIAELKAAREEANVMQQAKDLASSIGSGPGAKGSGPVGAKGWANAALKSMRGSMTTNSGGMKALVSGTIGVPDPVGAGIVAMDSAPRTILDLIRGEAPGNDHDAAYTFETADQLAGSLFGGGGTGGNTFSYLRQILRTNNAAPVADLATKPTSLYTVEEAEDRYRVIAHLSEPVPQRFFHDDKTLADFLAREMANGLEEELEAQVLNGDGTGENLTGILETSGTLAQPFVTDLFTTTRKALTQLQGTGVTPTAWALNPADAEAFDLLREGTGDGAFLLGGPGAQAGSSLWTLPRVPSVAVPAGTAVLADWTGAELQTRQGATLHVDAGGEHFKTNTVQFRVEGRYGLAVKRAAAFVAVDLTAA